MARSKSSSEWLQEHFKDQYVQKSQQEGIPFFIMEYVEGHELSDVMGKGELDFNRKLDILTQVCKALSYAHPL